jgi:hypothetical protein
VRPTPASSSVVGDRVRLHQRSDEDRPLSVMRRNAHAC